MARGKILSTSAGSEKIICCQCKGEYYSYDDDFFRSQSTLYSSGYLPICKDCILKMYNTYLYKYQDAKKAMQRICMAFDLYYSEKLFDKCLNKANVTTPVGDYIRKLNMQQYKGKTFDNTIDEGFALAMNNPAPVAPKKEEFKKSVEITIPESVRNRWGTGFSEEDYKNLEDHYRSLKRNNPNSEENQDIFIKQCCNLHMLMVRALNANDSERYAKLAEQYSKIFKQAGLRTTQDKDANSDDCWGVWMSRISQYTPEEYYKDKKLYRDFDGIGDYITRFMLRPLKNLQFGTTDRDKEFFVDDATGEDGEAT